MEIFLALFAAAGIILMISAMWRVHKAIEVIEESVAIKCASIDNLAFAIKAQNDAMLAAHGYGAGGGNSPEAGTMIEVTGGNGALWFG